MSFANLGLCEPILRAIIEKGYTQATPIQVQSIPIILKGGDLMAGSRTGTGKTAGFTLPLLHNLMQKRVGQGSSSVKALILTPTRELAAQVEESVKSYGKYLPLKSMCVFGGVNVNTQIKGLKGGCDILVATPGRLLDLISQKALTLANVEILVLDEADRMLDMGFIRDIKKILTMLPQTRQNLLFSATFSQDIKKLADGLLQSPQMIQVTKQNSTAEGISQTIHPVNQSDKRKLLSHIIRSKKLTQVLVFTRTKHGANKLTQDLINDGIAAAAIHGNKSQGARTRALSEFKQGAIRVLVATDIAARGLDIDQLPFVVNFELPNVAEDYVHRIGRTGRAGHDGEAVSLVCVDELEFLADIEKLLKKQLPKLVVPGFEPDLSIKPQPIAHRSFGRNKPSSGSRQEGFSRFDRKKKPPIPGQRLLHSAMQGHKH